MVDDLRARQRQPHTTEYDHNHDGRTVDSAEYHALHAIGTDRVLELLATLSDDQREVLTLRVIGDLTLEQVAEIMGRSPGAIKQLQRRALLSLRRLLTTEDVTV
jgi:RNA polymerase sigma-70 factor (ECF subfamily)